VKTAIVSPTEALEAGDEAVRKGNLEDARRAYESLLETDPNSSDAQAGLEYVAFLGSDRKSRYQWEGSEYWKEVAETKRRNFALILDEFEKGKTKLKAFPPNAFIEHTTRCNFYCPHCAKGYEPYPAVDMESGMVDKALDTLLPFLTRACITGFGEPTIGSAYNRIVKRLVANGVTTHFSTNVSTLTIPHIDSLVRGDADVILSIDGASKETFETIRAGGDWSKVLKSLAAIKRITAIHRTQARFSVTFVALRMNIHELPAMVRLVRDFNLSNLKVHDYQSIGKEFDKQSLRNEPEKANAYFEEAEKLATELGVHLILPDRYSVPQVGQASNSKSLSRMGRLFPARKRFPQRCIHPWEYTQIRPEGGVTPCCYSSREMGNLKKDSFESIWNGWRYRFFRWRVDSFFPPPECRECHVYEGINKGNAGNTMAVEGYLVRKAYGLERRISRFLAKWRSREPAAPAEVNKYFKGKTLKPDQSANRG